VSGASKSIAAQTNAVVVGGTLKQLRWFEPVRPRDHRHVRPGNNVSFDPFLRLPRPSAIAWPQTDRKPLGCGRDNFEILGVRGMFAHMSSWQKITRRFSDIEHHPIRGSTYTLTLVRPMTGKNSNAPKAKQSALNVDAQLVRPSGVTSAAHEGEI
jgi:hypothetical protein